MGTWDRALLCLVLALGLGLPVEASPQEAGERPRIGLALGGGGARGGAHLGVLKVLDELRIPIDYIAGTSAGAVIGGLYASGMSLRDLEATVRSLDWQNLLSDRPPRGSLSFLRKQDDRSIPSRVEVGFNEGRFSLPPGLINGQNVEVSLRSLTLPVARVRSFESLPTPFRAVATDLVTGEMVVLSEGDLATAIRASLSIPGAFAPVEIDGRLLVDGGVVRNLPVDVVRSMGADVVIAVNLTSELLTREELGSALTVASQTQRMIVLQNTRPQIEALVDGRDLLLAPDVKDVWVTDFRRLPETIEPGETIAREALDSLSRYSLSASDYARHRHGKIRVVTPEIPVDYVRVQGSRRLSGEAILGHLDIAPGDSLSAAELERALARVYGLGLFERVDYVIEEAAGQTGVVFRVTDKPWGPGFVRVGLSFGNDLERGSSSFTLTANHAQTRINRLGAELRSEVRLGEGQAFGLEFHQPLTSSGLLFASAAGRYREELLDLAVAGAGDASRDVDEVFVSAAVGFHFGNWGELRGEIVRGRADRKGDLLELEPEAPDFQIGGVLGRFTVDWLDDRAFPGSGIAGSLELYRGAGSLGSEPTYTRAEGSILTAVSRGDDALLMAARAGTSFDGGPLPPNHDLALGGFNQLSGLRPRELVGDHLLFGRVTYRRRLTVLPSGLAGGDLFAGASLEAGNVWLEREDVGLGDLKLSVGAFVGLETLVGPLYFSAAVTDGGDSTFFLYLGRAF
jgi:NTE family protein